MNLLEFMAWIGGIPTIITSLIMSCGFINIFHKRKEIKLVNSHISNMDMYEKKIKEILIKTKPINRYLFKKQAGKEYYKFYLSARREKNGQKNLKRRKQNHH